MYFNDYRLRRSLSTFVHRSPKKDMNAWNFRYPKLIVADKSKSVLFATLPKAGSNWTVDVVGYILGRHFHGKYNIEYDNSKKNLRLAVKRPFRWMTPADSRTSTYGNPKLRDIFPEVDIDFCLHTYRHWKYSPLWGLDNAKTILILRHIPTALYSFYRMRMKRFDSFREFLEYGFFERTINFYNSWGEFVKRNTRCKIIRYEDYKAEPVKYFGDLIEFAFSINVDKNIISEAVDYFDFDKQKEREYSIAKDEKDHFYFRASLNYENLISKEDLGYIYKRLQNELVHDFGYDYSKVVV